MSLLKRIKKIIQVFKRTWVALHLLYFFLETIFNRIVFFPKQVNRFHETSVFDIINEMELGKFLQKLRHFVI